jgi:predicted KAP-like P-loop ATPase
MTLPADNPIRSSEDDLLGRADPARSFARQLLSLDASEGLVIGVLGSWGSGKTSFVNLARDELASRADLLDFNPWMFSGAEQLVQSFFVEIAAQLKVRPGLAELGDDLQDYGEALSGLGWLPLVGPWIERGRGATKLVGQLLKRRREGASSRRDMLTAKLLGISRPIVVVLDDIDRLTSSEIRDVFRLVRLTASFPNLIYIVAFDRARVEAALGDEGIPGRDYLEKILQLAVDLPAVSDGAMLEQTIRALDEAVGEAGATLDESAWPDVFIEVIRPLIRNMRDVRRYAIAISITVQDVGERVQLVDVLALEAIRVFEPDVFAVVRRSVAALTTPSPVVGTRGDAPDEHKRAVDDLITAAGERGEVARSLVRRLFPAAGRFIGETHYGSDWRSTWLRDRRVANDEILLFHLERAAGTGLQAFDRAQQAFELLADPGAFDKYLRSIDPS